MVPGSLTDALRETLARFDGTGGPLTTTEVADSLDVGRRSAYERLDRLAERGYVETKRVGANGRVWWRAPASTPDARDGGEASGPRDEVYGRITDAFFALDEEWRFTYLNEHAERVLQRNATDLLGRVVWEAFPDAADSLFRREYEAAVETQETATFEEFYRPLDRWFEVRAYPSETGLSVYFRDVTERKEREAELERYETIFETAGDAIYVVDAERGFTKVNRAAVELTGYSREELLDTPVAELVGEDDATRALEAGERLDADEREVVPAEFTLSTNDGRTVPIEARFTRLPARDGGVELVGVARDVTERAQRERELERYRAVVETVNDGVYTVDADGHFTMVNETYAEMTGYPREELLGAHVSLVVNEETVETARNFEQELVAGDRETVKYEAEVLDADGEATPAEATFAILPGDGDERVAVVRDVSERVARERELERQRERLTALDDLNAVFRDITEAVIERSTRDEIEATVCERLAASDSYRFAWIGGVDVQSQTVTLRTEAGVEGYLDDATISVDPDDERSQGPTGRAVLEREMQASRDIRSDVRYEPWREVVREHGVRSSAAIPVVADDTLYGVLNVYSERPRAFGEDERAVVGQLGEVVGHAIAAVERKRALTSDEIVELEFQIPDVFGALDVPVSVDGAVTLDRSVPVGEDAHLVYGTATGDAMVAVEAVVEAGAVPQWESVTVLETEGGETRFELTLTEPPALSVVSAHGGRVQEARIEDGDYYMRVHLARTVDVRRVVDAIEDAYSAIELVTQRQFTRDERSTAQLAADVFEDLTDRQRSAVEAAYYRGYFSWPRKTKGEEIASSMGVSPSTFHQHLRTAHEKLLAALFDAGAASG